VSAVGGDTPQLPLVVEGAPPLSQQPLDTPERVRRETIRQIVRSPTFIVGALVTLFWVVCAIGGNHIAPYDPINGSFAASYEAPSWAHPFGIDRVGRDIFARVLVLGIVYFVATLTGDLLIAALNPRVRLQGRD
jgi:peptide/nickel transport system permease protein